MYGIDLQELLDANAMTDQMQVGVGQMLRIPGDRAPVPIPAPAESQPLDDDEFAWPLRGKVISTFGAASRTGLDKGMAIAPVNRDVVVASRSGKVVFSSDDFLDFGKTLIIEHAGGFWTVYGRNAEVFVKPGDTVVRGTPVARVGRAGRDPGTYLYFEIRKGHLAQNPDFYLSR